MPKGFCKPLTKEDEDKIKNEYLTKPVKRLANELGITYGRVMRSLAKNNLEIPRSVIDQRIAESRKKKGDIPFNKGLKQVDYMREASIEKTKKTRFKKGNLPHNTNKQGNGAIVARKDNTTGRYYKYIRLSKGNWVLYHRYLWELKNGDIPMDHLITFKDGDSMNVVIENLELISMTENMYRNSKCNYPKDIIPSLVLVKQLENKLKDIIDGK